MAREDYISYMDQVKKIAKEEEISEKAALAVQYLRDLESSVIFWAKKFPDVKFDVIHYGLENIFNGLEDL